MKYPNYSWALVSTSFLFALSSVVANATEEEIVEEIIVSATPLGRSANDLTQPVLVLNEEDLLTKATISIGRR